LLVQRQCGQHDAVVTSIIFLNKYNKLLYKCHLFGKAHRSEYHQIVSVCMFTDVQVLA